MEMYLGYVTRIEGGIGYVSVHGSLSEEIRFALTSEIGAPRLRPLRVGDWIEFRSTRYLMVGEFGRHKCQYISAPAAVVTGERQHFDVAMLPHYLVGMRGDTSGDLVVGSVDKVDKWDIIYRPSSKELFKHRRPKNSTTRVAEHLTHVTFGATLPESEIAASFSSPR